MDPPVSVPLPGFGGSGAADLFLGLFTLLITFLFKIVRGKPPARPWHLAGAEAPIEAAEQVAVRVVREHPHGRVVMVEVKGVREHGHVLHLV